MYAVFQTAKIYLLSLFTARNLGTSLIHLLKRLFGSPLYYWTSALFATLFTSDNAILPLLAEQAYYCSTFAEQAWTQAGGYYCHY